MSVCPVEKFYVIKIPWEDSLGVSEEDFSNVTAAVFGLDGNVLEEEAKVLYVPKGKLGSLKGGLVFLQDLRRPLSQKDVLDLAVEATRERLQIKRIGLKTCSHNLILCKLLQCT